MKFILGTAFLRFIIACLSLVMLFLIYHYSFWHSCSVDFYPINGTFQNFNAIRRLMDHQAPFKDFYYYLGLGPLYVLSFFTIIFGSSYSASVFSSYFVLSVLHLCWIYLLVSPLTKSKCLKIFLGFFSLSIFYSKIDLGIYFISITEYFQLWQEQIRPSNSLLGLRSAIPLIWCYGFIVSLAIKRFFPRFALLVLLQSVALIWSNDYGIPTFFVTAFSLYLVRDKIPHFERKQSLYWVFVGLALVISGVLIFIFTKGGLDNWVNYNFKAVAGNQFWYFVGDKNTNLISLPFDWIKGIGFLLVFRLAYIINRRSFNKDQFNLFVLLLTALSAGYLSALGGSVQDRYFQPFYIVFIFGLLFCVKESDLWQTRLLISVRSLFAKLRLFWVVTFCGGLIFFIFNNESIFFASKKHEQINRLFLCENKNNAYYDKMEGWLSFSYDKVIFLSEFLWKKYTDSPKNMGFAFSTYASLFELNVNYFQPTGIDYIIHALGDYRQNYMKGLSDGNFLFVNVIREDFTKWESWVRRVNWDFYKYLFQNYKPIDTTYYSTIFKKSNQGISFPNKTVFCKIERVSNGVYFLDITNSDKNLRSDYIASVNIDYNISIPNHNLKSLFLRPYLSAHQINYEKWKYEFGVPLNRSQWSFPVDLIGRKQASVLMKLGPQGVDLNIKSCNVDFLVDYQDLNFFKREQLVISRLQSPGGNIFFLDEKSDLYGFKSGEKLKFSNGQIRTIQEIIENKIILNKELNFSDLKSHVVEVL